MSVNNHTAISVGAAANASTVNSPLGQLDAAIGDLTTLTTTAKSTTVAAVNELDGEIGTLSSLQTTPKTSIVAAIGTDALSTTSKTIVGAINEVRDTYVPAITGSLATLKTKDITSAVAAINEVGGNHNWQYHTRGTVTWDATAKTLTFSSNAYVMFGTASSATYVVITGPFTIDFSGISANSYGFAYIKNLSIGTTNNKTGADITVAEWSALADTMMIENTIVLAFYSNHTKFMVQTPFITDELHTKYIQGLFTRREPWVNKYPQIYSKISGFVQKLLTPSADVKILLWGDSLFARTAYTSAVTDAATTPPTLTTKNIGWYIWSQLPGNKGVYKRYDTTSFFTEVGTWATSSADASWDDQAYRTGVTRLSAPGAGEVGSFAWTLDTSDDQSGCNLIYRTDTGGDAAADVTVAEGAGYLEYWTGAAWAEANGTTMSFLEADTGARRGNTIYGKTLKFRKAAAHLNASVTITISRAAADTDRLLYWGVQLYDNKNGKWLTQFYNAARGSHTFDQGSLKLYDYMDDDVIDQAPDLVIVEIPLLNMIAAAGATKTIIVNSVQDMIWGDRGGATNVWNLKTQSSDWANFQVIAVIPHYSHAHFNSDGTFLDILTDTTAMDIYNAVKALIISKGDVGLIDLSSAVLREIDADPLYSGQYYTGTATSSATGDTYLSDGLHQNDKGTLVYARHLCPILDCNTV